jgi:glycopeptide antibiotics resistance protein
MSRKVILIFFTITLAVIIGGSLTNMSNLYTIRGYLPFLPDNDVLHFVCYTVLSFFSFELISNNDTKRHARNSLLFALVVLGVAIEITQEISTETRHAELQDFIANTSGVLLGMTFHLIRSKELYKIVNKPIIAISSSRNTQ